MRGSSVSAGVGDVLSFSGLKLARKRSMLLTVLPMKWLALWTQVWRLERMMRAPWLMVGTATERKRRRMRAWKAIHRDHGAEAWGAAVGEAADDGFEEVGEDSCEGDRHEDGLEELEDSGEDADDVDRDGGDGEKGRGGEGHPERAVLEVRGPQAAR
jgi:hypothetical protein